MSHSHFKREGSDIHYTAEISLSDALNGGTAKVKHFNETHTFKFEVSVVSWYNDQNLTF